MVADGGRDAGSGPTGDGADDRHHGALDDERATVDETAVLAPEEAAVLDGFNRLTPEGSSEWQFEEAMRRLDRPEHRQTTPYPWPGTPADLWERGRAARIGRRFVGDVTAALGDLLAHDARKAADAAVNFRCEGRFAATYDALLFLAARVGALEERVDPTGTVPADYELPQPDCSEWTGSVTEWLGDALPAGVGGPLVVGEARVEGLLAAAVATGRPVVGVEPRGPQVWDRLAAGAGSPAVVLAEPADYLAAMGDASAAGVVLAGVVDRIDLADKCAVVRDALRVTVAGGRLVLFATDQRRWDESVPPVPRDLLPGRPLHPETWTLLFRRAGAERVTWHRPSGDGAAHCLVVETRGR